MCSTWSVTGRYHSWSRQVTGVIFVFVSVACGSMWMNVGLRPIILSWQIIVYRLFRLRLLRKRFGVLGNFLGREHPDKTTCPRQRAWWHLTGLYLQKIKARGQGQNILPNVRDRAPRFADFEPTPRDTEEPEPEEEDLPNPTGGASSSSSSATQPINVVGVPFQININIHNASTAIAGGKGGARSSNESSGSGRGQGGHRGRGRGYRGGRSGR